MKNETYKPATIEMLSQLMGGEKKLHIPLKCVTGDPEQDAMLRKIDEVMEAQLLRDISELMEGEKKLHINR